MLSEDDLGAIGELLGVVEPDSGSADPSFYATAAALDAETPSTAAPTTDRNELEALIETGPWRLQCPACRTESHVSGPFDLVRVRCPKCSVLRYPFLEIEGRNVDLWRLRTFLINLYYYKSAALEVLMALGAKGSRAQSVELDLPPRLILGHALASILAHNDAECEQPYAYYLMGCVFPLLPWAFRVCNRHELREALRSQASHGVFARNSFDPAVLPFRGRLGAVSHLPVLTRLRELFHVGTISDRLQTTDHDGYADSFGDAVHEWSLAIDRRRRVAGIESEERGDLYWNAERCDEFSQAIAQRVVASRRDVGQRSFNLDMVGPQRNEEGSSDGGPDDSRTAGVTRAKLIEMIDYSTGAVVRTILRTTASWKMIGVEWQVVQRLPAASTLLLGGKTLSAEAEMCRAETMQGKASPWDTELDRISTDMGPPTLALGSCLIPAGVLWIFGLTGYFVFVFVFCCGIARVYRVRWFPLPRRFGDEGRRGLLASYLGFPRAVYSARAAAVEQIAQKWGQADCSSRPSMAAAFMEPGEIGMTAHGDARFAAWVHNEQVANAVVSAARALGIDMDDSEERILEIVNHGIIAHSIQGGASVGPASRRPEKPGRRPGFSGRKVDVEASSKHRRS